MSYPIHAHHSDRVSDLIKHAVVFFRTWGLAFPADGKQLVYTPLGTPEVDAYLDDMGLGANFATVNYL